MSTFEKHCVCDTKKLVSKEEREEIAAIAVKLYAFNNGYKTPEQAIQNAEDFYFACKKYVINGEKSP